MKEMGYEGNYIRQFCCPKCDDKVYVEGTDFHITEYPYKCPKCNTELTFIR